MPAPSKSPSSPNHAQTSNTSSPPQAPRRLNNVSFTPSQLEYKAQLLADPSALRGLEASMYHALHRDVDRSPMNFMSIRVTLSLVKVHMSCRKPYVPVIILRFLVFRQASRELGRGRLSPSRYYSTLVHLFGTAQMTEVLPALITALPSQSLRSQLIKLHEERQVTTPTKHVQPRRKSSPTHRPVKSLSPESTAGQGWLRRRMKHTDGWAKRWCVVEQVCTCARQITSYIQQIMYICMLYSRLYMISSPCDPTRTLVYTH